MDREAATKTQRVNVHLDKKLVAQVDRLAKRVASREVRVVPRVEIVSRLLRAGLRAEKGGK